MAAYNERALRIADSRYATLVRECSERYPTLLSAELDGRGLYISNQNGKLKKDKIAAWSLLALANCNSFGACGRICYATSNMFVFPYAVRTRWVNYLYTLDPLFVGTWIRSFGEQIPRTWRTVRIHDSGDFYSAAYVQKWADIARQLPHIQFYAYTKEFHRLEASIAELGALPNVQIIQSAGGRDDRCIDPDQPHSRIFPDLESLLAAGYEDCSHSDLRAAYGEVTRVGLIVHSYRGEKNYQAKRFTDQPGNRSDNSAILTIREVK